MVNSIAGPHKDLKMAYSRKEVPLTIVPFIKRARAEGYKYAPIAAYYVINQAWIADVMKGRIGPDIAPADHLPPDFPPLG